MWQYMWAHTVYHLIRWFPRNNRIKITLVVMALTVAMLMPQLWVLLQKHTTRWCSQPLFPMLITSIVFTFFVIGFAFLFVTMVPVPREVKIAFHVFGLVNFITGIIQVVFTSNAEDCNSSTEELYKMSLALAILSAIALVYIVLLLPFWVVNVVKRDCVLDTRERQGVCYEPVKCCSCLWHI
ncbi:uncharacterized protein LOC143302053 [Babylonia areolata]|uniref:uncharacterized protein LOC143302053 n=1 Tax=Babylonia areolata TaxID=304850 RepID=UPI003FD19AA6